MTMPKAFELQHDAKVVEEGAPYSTPTVFPRGMRLYSAVSVDEIVGDATVLQAWMKENGCTPSMKASECDILRKALNTALTELRAIQARDGAPQHIVWDRGRPLQSDSCTHEWFATVVERCEAALALGKDRP